MVGAPTPARALLFQSLADYGARSGRCNAIAVASQSGAVLGSCADAPGGHTRFEPGAYTEIPPVAGAIGGIAHGISGDGTLIVGYELQPGCGSFCENTATWNELGLQTLLQAEVVGQNEESPAPYDGVAISDDGVVTAGSRLLLGSLVQAWVDGGPGFPLITTMLPVLEACDVEHYAALSPDGHVVAVTGHCHDFFDVFTDVHRIARSDGTHVDNTDLPDTRAFSTDGAVWVGADAAGFAARHSGATAALGALGLGETSSVALDVSADGAVVIGRSTTSSGDVAFLWDPGGGLRTLRSELESLGADLTGWTLEEAVAISADGHLIAGNGTNPEGQSEGFVADLSAASAPVPVLGAPARVVSGAVLALVGWQLARRKGGRGDAAIGRGAVRSGARSAQ